MKSFVEGKNLAQLRKQFENEGVILLPNIYDLDFCEKAKGFIDTWNGDKDTHYNGSEIRIWDVQKKQDFLEEFYNRCHQTISELFSREHLPHTLLAIRNLPVPRENLDLKLGRWHLDSFCDQVKIFLFLSETSDESGPFEFIPGSHQKKFKFKNLLSGRYLSPLDLLGKSRKYQSLNEGWVENLGINGMPTQPVICDAGTVMIVNTSAIHRARPCLAGSRYALTAYYH